MGRLVLFEQLEPDPSWHLQGAYYDRDMRKSPWSKEMGGWRCDVEKENMPTLYVHRSNMSLQNKIAIRRWVEQNLSETVITVYREFNYYYHFEYKGRNSWDDHDTEKSHGYQAFIFESDDSAVLFKLQFPELCTEIHWLHPEHVGEEKLRAQRQGSPSYWNGLGEEFPYR